MVKNLENIKNKDLNPTYNIGVIGIDGPIGPTGSTELNGPNGFSLSEDIGNLLDDVVKSAREQIEMEKVKNEFVQRN